MFIVSSPRIQTRTARCLILYRSYLYHRALSYPKIKYTQQEQQQQQQLLLQSVPPTLTYTVCHDTTTRSLQVRLEQERVAALVAGRRQREAALVGKFDSDEIYNLEDENGLAMRQAQRESRCRVLALCEGRKLADTTALITDDLIRELQTFLTRCVPAPVLLYTRDRGPC